MNRSTIRTFLAFCLALSTALVPSWTSAQEGWDAFGADPFGTGAGNGLTDSDPVAIEAQFTAATEDRPAILMVTANLAPGWHTYSLEQQDGGPLPTDITLVPSAEYRTIGRFMPHPRPLLTSYPDVWPGLPIEEHADKVTWYIPIEIAQGIDPAGIAIRGKVNLQVCKENCLPPDGREFEARLGPGVEIGRVRVNTEAAAPKAAQLKPDPMAAPPAEAGVLKVGESVVTWYGWLANSTVKPGERAYLQFRAEMPQNWHINAYAKSDPNQGAKPTLIALEESEAYKWAEPDPAKSPTEKPSPVPNFGPLRYHEELAIWTVAIDIPADAKAGPIEIEGKLGYHACEGSDRCEAQPIGIEFRTTLHVGETTQPGTASVSFTASDYDQVAKLADRSAPTASMAPGIPGLTTGDLRIIEFNGAATTSLTYVLVAALAGGLLLNLMPCVLPVLGLKIMSFAKQGGESRARVFTLNFAYVLGLLAVFMLLATLASLPQLFATGGEGLNWGELNTFTSFKVGMTVLVFAMALSFLGVWEIPIPGFVGGAKASELASREGHGGAFLKGVLTTVLATPCSGPFLGPVFGFTMGQEVAVTYLVFLFVGLGMALPYLIIGLNPRLVQWIPKPGAWMDTFKQFMGFVLLATVVYLFSTINAEFYIETLSLCVAVWFACWLGGSQSFTASFGRRFAGWLTGAGVATAVGYIAFGPPLTPQYPLPWTSYSSQAIAKAQSEGRTVLLDFTANWCLTCQWNLQRSLDVAAVKTVVEENDVAAIKADWTDRDPEIKAALDALESRSIPLLAIFPADRPGEVIVLRDVVTKQQVLQALAQAGAEERNPERGYVPVNATPEQRAVARN